MQHELPAILQQLGIAVQREIRELHAKLDKIVDALYQPPEPDFYSVNQAAKATGWKPYTLRQRCNKGVIRAEKQSDQWRIPRSEVERIRNEGLPPLPTEKGRP